MCFFTPYLEFPTISVTYRSTVLCGISLGNSFYNAVNIGRIFSYWDERTHHLVTFIPDGPSFHTYKAKNKTSLDIHIIKKCKRDSTVLHRIARDQAVNKKFQFENAMWEDLINKNPELYAGSLELIVNEYNKGGVLTEEVNNVTIKVVKDGDVHEGAKFLLKELAMIRIAPELLQVESVIYSYHLDFPIVEKMLLGQLEIPPIYNVFVQTVG